MRAVCVCTRSSVYLITTISQSRELLQCPWWPSKASSLTGRKRMSPLAFSLFTSRLLWQSNTMLAKIKERDNDRGVNRLRSVAQSNQNVENSKPMWTNILLIFHPFLFSDKGKKMLPLPWRKHERTVYKNHIQQFAVFVRWECRQGYLEWWNMFEADVKLFFWTCGPSLLTMLYMFYS